jgi:hypothetical protein
MTTKTLLSSVIATGASAAVALNGPEFTAQASGLVTATTGAATVKIQVSNDNANWIDLGTITLTLGTSVTSDGLAAFARWALVRANVTAISGTNAAVTVTLKQS